MARKRMERSRLNHWGFLGLNFMYSLKSTKVMGAQPMGRPGWPELAFSTASMAGKRMELMHSRVSASIAFSGRVQGRPSQVVTALVARTALVALGATALAPMKVERPRALEARAATAFAGRAAEAEAVVGATTLGTDFCMIISIVCMECVWEVV